MEIEFTKKAKEDLDFWDKSGNKMIQKKIKEIFASIKGTPFSGIGKPESLKYHLTDCFSRRIDKEHRVVYSVDLEKQLILILQCRFHY